MLETPEKSRGNSSRQGRLLALPVVLAAVIVLASIVFLLASLLGVPEPDTGSDTGVHRGASWRLGEYETKLPHAGVRA